MHVNFATDKKFEFNLKGLEALYRDFTLNRFNMLAIASAVLLFMILFGTVQKFRLDSVELDVAKIEKEAMALKKQMKGANVGVHNVSKGEIFFKFDKRPNWAALLKDASKSVPRNVFLQSIKSGKDKNGGLTLEIKGQASDQSGVVDLTTALGNTGSCGNVKVVSSEAAQKTDTSALNFTIMCDVKK